jgi:hypothetical protein
LKVKELWTVIASRFSVEVENKLETVGNAKVSYETAKGSHAGLRIYISRLSSSILQSFPAVVHSNSLQARNHNTSTPVGLFSKHHTTTNP